MYFIIPHIYFRVNLKMKKPTLCCRFTWIVFIKLNFTVALSLIRKTWMTDLPVRWGGWGILRNWGGPSNGGMILKWGRLIPLYGLWPGYCFSWPQISKIKFHEKKLQWPVSVISYFNFYIKTTIKLKILKSIKVT